MCPNSYKQYLAEARLKSVHTWTLLEGLRERREP